MQDLALDKNYKIGSRGKKVRLIQGWLCLHGFNLVVDGKFGPATDAALRQFQRREGLKEDGIVGRNTFAKLVLPMSNALRSIPSARKSLDQMVVTYAKQHLRQHPREVGGQNRGPWVRLYMNGNEGTTWPWCAGFVSFILKLACQSLGIPLPIMISFSCDTLAANAREKGKFLKAPKIADRGQITPGSFFLKRRTSTNWVHIGIVTRIEHEYFHTIEGNTNDDGYHEGYEVCKRTRGYQSKDFIVF